MLIETKSFHVAEQDDPFVKELVSSVLQRVEQGMDDEQLAQYLDYRKRGVPPGEERDVINHLKWALREEGTHLFERVRDAREAEARAERARRKQREWEAKERARMQVGLLDIDVLWRDEQRYKRSLIPDDAWGGGGNGRRRKKPQKAHRWYRRGYET